MNLVVWIDVLEVAERESAGRLCRRHANALVGPRGWTTDDRREPVPKLFRSAELAGADAGSVPKKRKERQKRPPDVDTPSLFESIRRELDTEPEPQSASAAGDESVGETDAGEIDPDETQALPWSPRLGKGSITDDGTPKPTFGRLLGRAFGDSMGPQ